MIVNKVLHIIPDSTVNESNLHLGSTKDFRGHTEYFHARSIPFDELAVKDRSDNYLLHTVKTLDLSQYRVIFFELALYPKTMRFIRKHFPTIKLITRSINADFYHFLHYFMGSIKYFRYRLSLKAPFKSIKYLRFTVKYLWLAVQHLFLDFRCARLSDYILSIVEWEKENYWRFLVSKTKIKNLPYFLPFKYENEVVEILKKDQCICLMSTSTGPLPLLQDALFNFNHLVEKLGTNNPEWSFFITGDMSRLQLTYPSRVSLTGFLDNPFPLLVESRAMAMLSNLGFGFKTKLLDAIKSKCYTLVPARLFARLPEEIKLYCIVVDLPSVESFRQALAYSKRPFPAGDPNALFKGKAFAVLDEIFEENKN